MTNLPIAIRQASNPDDLAFFFSASLRANYLLSSTNRLIPPEIYYPAHKRVLQRVMDRVNAKLLIACDDAEPDVIYGFVLAEPVHGILHFTYVKKALRKFGVMTQLLDAAELSLDRAEFSHWTFDLAAVLAPRKDSRRRYHRYNPYLLESPVEESAWRAG